MDFSYQKQALKESNAFMNLSDTHNEITLVSNKLINLLLKKRIKDEEKETYNINNYKKIFEIFLNDDEENTLNKAKTLYHLFKFHIGRYSMLENKNIAKSSLDKTDYKTLLQLAVVNGENCFEKYDMLKHITIKSSAYASVDDFLISETIFELNKMIDIIKIKDRDCDASEALKIFSYIDNEVSTIIENDYYDYLNEKEKNKK